MITTIRNFSIIDSIDFVIASVINKVISCQGVITKTQDDRQTNEFSALVYVLLESFQIDSGEDRFMISKWYVNGNM